MIHKSPLKTKTAIISDIHLGVHGAEDRWHETALKYAVWLRDKLEEQGIRQLFILGDVFNDRKEISGSTISVAGKFFDTLSQFEIFVLVGNHDCFYANDTTVNALAMLSRWKNISVVSEMTEYDVGGKSILMCPWGVNPMSLGKRFDAVFGHFEINSFNMTQMQVCEDGFDSSDVRKVSSLVFSGHFHLQDDRQYGEDRIIYVGCPFQMTWADYGATKSVYLYDFDTGEVDKFDNTVSPTYIKVDVAKFHEEGFSAGLKELVVNNIVRITSSSVVEQGDVDQALACVQGLNPREVTCDIARTPLAMVETDDDESDVVEAEMTTEDRFKAYVDIIETSVDKTTLYRELVDIYKLTKKA